MHNAVFVVDNPSRWPLDIPGIQLISAKTYLTDPSFSTLRQCRVYNLCRSYRYQSVGYYVSLLAEARGHKPIPKVATLQDLKHQSLFKAVSSDLQDQIHRSLAPLQGNTFTLSIYFSRNMAKRYERLARQLFNLFPIPLLRAQFRKEDSEWALQSLSPIAANDIPKEHLPYVVEFAKDYFTRGSTISRKKAPRFYMAILFDSEETTPPSNEKAIQRFVTAAENMGISTEIITREDYGRISEFDALFIRQTTAVSNHTYRFARRAEAEGLVVIDDPISIVRCTNKVYLAELLARYQILAPKTRIVHRDNLQEVRNELGLPLILKEPDSAFSLGVRKIETDEQFQTLVMQGLEKSEMLIAQEFLETSFDWRIAIIDQKPLYACKYFMARGHWQIYNNEAKGSKDYTGDFETLPVELAPRKVVQTALKAANLIGNGLYGVDLKEINGKAYVIEVNDNPSIDYGVEDHILRQTLYERIMEVFLKRLEQRRMA